MGGMSSRSGRPLATTGALPVLAALLTACLVLLGPAPAALGHDELTDTEPVDGETLEQTPQEVTLNFSGDLTTLGAQVEVSGPSGSVADAEPQIEGAQLRQPLSTDVPPGDYAVVWRVTSQDGHPISGTFDFTVEDPGTQPSPTDDQSSATAGVDQTAREASTEAVDISSDDPADGATASWLWVLVGVALLALLGVGTLALRRR